MLRVLQHYLPIRTTLLVFGESLLLLAVVGCLMSMHLWDLAAGIRGEEFTPIWRDLVARELYAREALEIAITSSVGVVILTQITLAFARLYEFALSASPFRRAARFIEAGGAALFVNLLLLVIAHTWDLERVHTFPGLSGIQAVVLLVTSLTLGLGLAWIYRALFHALLRRSNLQLRILIIGSGGPAHALAREVLRHPEAGYRIVGMVPEDTGKQDNGEAQSQWLRDPTHQATRSTQDLILEDVQLLREQQAAGKDKPEPPAGRLRAIVRELGADAVVVAIEDRRKTLPTGELLDCRLAGFDVREQEELFEEITGRIAVSAMRPSYLIYNEGFRRQSWAVLAKRLMDITGALFLLFFLWPAMLVSVVWVRRSSPGPALFKQERIGLHGRPFTLIKFRSMREDAEATSGPVWAAGDDPRITRMGRFMRKTRLDELPQLFNVLAGSMSMVGPRPEREHFIRSLTEKIPYYDQRHIVKPGLTGWAQVNHPYGNTEEDALAKLQYDLFYVKNQSVLFDLSILVTTIRTVVLRQGT
jgi:sugar transferase (PEP-CTERM system associated)